jgi:hypothetical protein
LTRSAKRERAVIERTQATQGNRRSLKGPAATDPDRIELLELLIAIGHTGEPYIRG